MPLNKETEIEPPNLPSQGLNISTAVLLQGKEPKNEPSIFACQGLNSSTTAPLHWWF